MSGRIALMVRGLPSIGIDEAVERFGKYYPEKQSVTYHRSPSFIGTMSDNHVAFADAKTKDYFGSSPLDLQKRRDLRKLWEDFNSFSEANPGIYTNSPNTKSKAKLYKRVGFQESPDSMFQVMDSRRIAEDDLPYVKALDSAIIPKDTLSVLGNNSLPAFIKSGDNIVATSRLSRKTLTSVLRGELPYEALQGTVQKALDSRKKNLFNNDIEVGYATGHSTQSSQTQDALTRQRAINEANLARQRAINEEIILANRARYANPPARPSVIDELDDIPF